MHNEINMTITILHLYKSAFIGNKSNMIEVFKLRKSHLSYFKMRPENKD